MLDDVYKKFSNDSPREFAYLLKSNKQFLEAVQLSRKTLPAAYVAQHPDIAARHKQMSEKERAKYAQQAADILATHIAQEKSKVTYAADASVSDPKGVKQNQLRLDMLNDLESTLANEITPAEGVKYTDMTELQKHQFGKEFGLNSFNESDRKKLDETATKLQEQSRIRREQSKFEAEHPWTNLALDIFTPASQNARRRGEEPSITDIGLDLASNVATFVPLVGPAAKLGLAAKVASKLKSPAVKLATRLTPAASDIAANTAVTTAIDARNQKTEDEEFGKFKPEQLAKNLGTAVAGTALSGLATRKSIPELAKTKIDPYIPNASKWLESKLVNPAEAVRDEMLRKNENITSSLAKASTGKFYEPEVRAVLKKAEIGESLTAKDMKLLKKAGISEADLDTYLTQRANTASVQSLKKPVTLTEQRINEFNDARVKQDAIKDTELGKHVNLEESMYAVPLNEESGYKKLLNAERKRRT